VRQSQLWSELPKGGVGGHGAGASLKRHHLTGAILLNDAPLPRAFNWANVSGVSFVTPVRNQHIPTYCGSCWAFAATNVLADRWNVAYRNTGSPPPDLVLSTQNVLSCGNDLVSCGTCRGGDDASVFVYAQQHGIPHESCSNYMAKDTTCIANAAIEGDNRPHCYNCDEEAQCFSIKEYHRLFVRENSIGKVEGPVAMKAEILANGPISCGIMATNAMEHKYSNGVFSEPPSEIDSRINHVVEVFGWGVDNHDNEYWHVKNSWGSEWGEDGYMRLVTSDNTGPAGRGNNLVETECTYATPDRYAMQ